jgi:hypothetical protein
MPAADNAVAVKLLKSHYYKWLRDLLGDKDEGAKLRKRVKKAGYRAAAARLKQLLARATELTELMKAYSAAAPSNGQLLVELDRELRQLRSDVEAIGQQHSTALTSDSTSAGTNFVTPHTAWRSCNVYHIATLLCLVSVFISASPSLTFTQSPH